MIDYPGDEYVAGVKQVRLGNLEGYTWSTSNPWRKMGTNARKQIAAIEAELH